MKSIDATLYFIYGSEQKKQLNCLYKFHSSTAIRGKCYCMFRGWMEHGKQHRQVEKGGAK